MSIPDIVIKNFERAFEYPKSKVYKQRPTFRARDPEDYEKISCVVIGINPGKLEKGEPEYNECKKKNDETIYQKQVKYFKDHKMDIPYNYRIEEVLRVLGLRDDDKSVLWTELCKCQLLKEENARASSTSENLDPSVRCV